MEFVCFSFHVPVGLLFYQLFVFQSGHQKFYGAICVLLLLLLLCKLSYRRVTGENTLFHTNNCRSAKPACSASLPLCLPTVAVIIITILCSNVHSKNCAVLFVSSFY